MAMIPGIKLDTHKDSDHIDRIETLARSRDWLAARLSDDRVELSVTGQWNTYLITFDWRWETDTLKMTCVGDQRLDTIAADECLILQQAINKEIDFGQIGVSSDFGGLTLTHSIHLFDGDNELTPGYIEWLTERAVDLSDHYFPAYHLVVQHNAMPKMALKMVVADQPAYWA